jgi:two-component system chemotaxis response regulator CheY
MTNATRDGRWYAVVADDDDDWRSLVSMALRDAGFQVCEACDGEELLARYAALRVLTGQHVVVVSDIGMPGLDGVAATAELRNASEEVPILLVTGERSPRVLTAAHAAGATLVIAKPVDRGELVRAVRQLCSNH